MANKDRLLGTDPINAVPWRSPDPPERILAIRLQALGDTVGTLPYLQALRSLLPSTRLDFLTREEVADIPKSVGLFDRVFEIGGERSGRRQMLSTLALLPRLSRRRYDVVIDLQRNRISRAVRTMLRPTSWSEFDRFSPALGGERARATIEATGLGGLVVYPVPSPEIDSALEKLRGGGWDGASGLVVLNPLGAFPGRAWPPESYARFAELWSAQSEAPTQFLLLGLPGLRAAAAVLRSRLGDRLIDLFGRTTPSEAFALIGRAVLVVSGDSGLMHMAWVTGVTTVALFGASRSAWASPHGNYSECVNACPLADGICMDGTCRQAPPPCLAELSPGAVLERAQALMRRTEGARKVIYSGAAEGPR